jgi:hypothetical protein
VPVQLVQADAPGTRAHRGRVLVGAVWEPGDQVQARGGAAHADAWHVRGQRADQDLALGAIAPPHRAQMPLERRVLDERGHRDLVERRRRHAGNQQGVLDVVDQVRRRHHPGQAQRRRQRLAGRPDEGNEVRREALQ